MPAHTLNIKWKRNDAVFSDAKYKREHLITYDGGVSIIGSSSPSVVPPPMSKIDAADPEELVMSGLASCHMLWALDFARRAGFVVNSYEDNPEGVLGKNQNGKIAFVNISLNPKMSFEGNQPTQSQLEEIHHKSHEACFIANSLNCPIDIKPILIV